MDTNKKFCWDCAIDLDMVPIKTNPTWHKDFCFKCKKPMYVLNEDEYEDQIMIYFLTQEEKLNHE